MLDFVIGVKTKPTVNNLIDALKHIDWPEGIVYIGFPILTTESDASTIDALFTSMKSGVVIFDLLEHQPNSETWYEIDERQSRLVAALTSRLLLYKDLRKGRQLAFEINVITYSPIPLTPPTELPIVTASAENLNEVLLNFPGIDEGLIIHLNAALQSVSTIKPRKKRPTVKQSSSRGSILKEIEKNIANLDYWQRRAAIESPEGPQRIRGIAGSGKTIVLALKAAYLHALHPDWTIAVTFQTRSLYQQFLDLIRRFYFDQQRDEPDFTKLLVLHAWGSGETPGIYSQIASSIGKAPESFLTARSKYGIENAFEGVCNTLVSYLVDKEPPLQFDAVLIDEAQDLPISFFQLIYKLTKPPKRIVWAYDELQNLGSYSMVSPSELFGALVELRNIPGEPNQDIILPVCYRNTPWALATAHALGFGIYREGGPCQFFDEPALWNDIGYEVIEGNLTPGQHVKLARRSNCSPRFFENLISHEDAIQSHVFSDGDAEIEWVVGEIKKNLIEDELDRDDILVIFPDPVTVTHKAGPLISALAKDRIPAHIVGVTNSKDEIFIPDSIAISGIRRAKGNEAPMVYVLQSQYCFSAPQLPRKRNILFTAITRSRSWVRICGSGPLMEKLDKEVKEVVKNEYKLSFRVPTDEELNLLRKIHRDMTSDEKRIVTEAMDKMSELFELVESGDLAFETLPEEIRTKLKNIAKKIQG